MNILIVFFPKIRVLSFNFEKRVGETFPLLSSSSDARAYHSRSLTRILRNRQKCVGTFQNFCFSVCFIFFLLAPLPLQKNKHQCHSEIKTQPKLINWKSNFKRHFYFSSFQMTFNKNFNMIFVTKPRLVVLRVVLSGILDFLEFLKC